MRRNKRVREAKQALYRDLVLDAAERVFAAEGYDAAKIEQIARESGLSLGTVYTVFPGKAALFRAVHERHAGQLLRRGQGPEPRAGDPLEALLAGVRGYIGYFLEHPDYLRMNLQEGATWGVREAGARGRERVEAWSRGVEQMSRAIERCIEAGCVHPGDPRLQARMLIAMQQVQLAHWVESGMTVPPEAVALRIAGDARRFLAGGSS